MSIFGSDSIKIQFTLDSVDYEKTLKKVNYFYGNDYNKKILKVRRDVRTGNKKQTFKGNYKKFKYSLFNITRDDYNDFWTKIKTLNNIKYFPHVDLDYSYEVYCDKMEFKTLDDNSNIGIIEFEFKSNNYKDLSIPTWILETGIWDSTGVWLPSGIWKNGV